MVWMVVCVQQKFDRLVTNRFESSADSIGKRCKLIIDQKNAFVAETVVGATAGAVPPAPGYFREIRRICDAYGVLLILDEVMCGMGRTGTLFACEHEQLVPDIIAVAKGLGGGYQPIGAMLARDALVDVIARGSGAPEHGHTYLAHATASAAAILALAWAVSRRK